MKIANRKLGGARAKHSGASWENTIIANNQLYRQLGLADVDKLPTPTIFTKKGIVFQRGELVDFAGFIATQPPIPVRFEAKSSETKRWDFGYWKPIELCNTKALRKANRRHQYLSLKRLSDAGGLAFVLFQWRYKMESGKDKIFDYPAWLIMFHDIEKAGVWSLPVSEIKKIGIPVYGGDWLKALIKAGIVKMPAQLPQNG